VTESGSGRRIAILIGTNEYSKIDKLEFAESDAREMGKVLLDPDICGFDEVIELINKNKEEVSKAIESVFKKAKKEDQVLIYYSGHGKPSYKFDLCLLFKETDPDSLLATSLKFDYINECKEQSACNRVVVILDCCYSGTAGMKGDYLQEMLSTFSGSGTILLTSTGQTGSNIAKEDKELKHGVFTYYLLKGLKDWVADYDSDGVITVEDLYRYTFSETKAKGLQRPQKKGSYEGEMVLGRNPQKIRNKEFELKKDKLMQYLNSASPSVIHRSFTILQKMYNNPSALDPLEIKIKSHLESLLNDEIEAETYVEVVKYQERIRKQQEEDEKRKERLEKEKKEKEEQEKLRKQRDEELQRQREEEERKKEKEFLEKQQLEEQERKHKEEEKARREKEEQEKRRIEDKVRKENEEQERKNTEEEEKAKKDAEEKARKEKEEQERLRKQKEEAEKLEEIKKAHEETERRKKEEEKKQQEELRRQKEETEQKQREEKRKKEEKEELERKQREEDEKAREREEAERKEELEVTKDVLPRPSDKNISPKILVGVILGLIAILAIGLYLLGNEQPPVPPTIESFNANPERVISGENITLSWNVSNSTRVTINPGIGDVELSGSIYVSPAESTTYTLLATNKAGDNVTKNVTVESIKEPKITSFEVNPEKIVLGNNSTLSWSVSGGENVTITPEIGNVELNGSKIVKPTTNTTYTIIATNEAGNDSVTRVVTVENKFVTSHPGSGHHGRSNLGKNGDVAGPQPQRDSTRSDTSGGKPPNY
jgi:hypothetical protein